MRNKKGFLKSLLVVIFTVVLLLGKTNVLAASTNLLEGADLSSPGKTVTFDIKINADTTVNSYNATLTYETSILEFVGIENKNNWKGSNAIADSPVELSFTRENGITGESVVATLTFKVKADVTKADTVLTLEGRTTDEEGGTINNLTKTTKNLAIKSTDNTLKDLKLNGTTIVNFSPNTYSYALQVPAITVTANIDATLNSATATFVEGYGSRAVPLEYGDNVIEVKVKSAAGEEKTYVLTITRQDNRGTNNDLKSLILNAGKVKLNFNKDVLEYRIKTYQLETIEVDATAEDDKAEVKIDKPEQLVIGQNVISIVVTSEDGHDKTYKVILDNVDYMIDTALKDLELFGCDENIHFKPDVFDYEVRYKTKYKDSLVIKPIVRSVDEDVKIDEPLLEKTMSNLEVGSVVQIRVYATDGTESMYTITFIKDTRLNFFLLLGSVIFVVLLVIFIVLLVKYRKEKKKEKQIKEVKKNKENKNIEKTIRMDKID